METDKSRLYDLIYGMELFKPRFRSDEARRNASLGLLEKFSAAYSGGNLIGPVDFNTMVFDLNTGEILSFPMDSVPMANCTYDQYKFFPEEYFAGAPWGHEQDLYTVSVILYVLRYYSLPYDGNEECRLVKMKPGERKDRYRSLRFVFSDGENNNALNRLIGATTIDLWNEDENTNIKDAFCRVFDNRSDSSNRLEISEWMDLLGIKHEQDDTVRTLVKDGVSIRLTDGLEILRKDICLQEDDRKIGVIVSSNKDKTVLALGNTSEETWIVDLPDGKKLSVAPQSAAPISKGATIDFGFDKVSII